MSGLNFGLGDLGVTEQALQDAILRKLGMTKEQAVRALAQKFGVSFEQPAAPASAVKSGDTVQTAEGPARALVIKSTDLAALANAARILNGFTGNGAVR